MVQLVGHHRKATGTQTIAGWSVSATGKEEPIYHTYTYTYSKQISLLTH